MRRRSFTTLAIAATAMVTTFACSGDSPSAPQNQIAPSSQGSQGRLLRGLLAKAAHRKVVPLLRDRPITANVSVSKSIGALGGTINLPEAGLTIVVPPLAVSGMTNFKITARRGLFVAYDMEPHGTKFFVPLIATQNLGETNARGILNLSLSLGHFENEADVTDVSEEFSVSLNLLQLTAISTIPHFSGYIFAIGREQE